MALAEITRSPTRRAKSATEVMQTLDLWKFARLGVWLAFCVLLIVLA